MMLTTNFLRISKNEHPNVANEFVTVLTMKGSRYGSNRSKLIVTLCLLWAFFLPISFAAPAESYKWKDTEGIVLFSNTSPPVRAETEIERIKQEYSTIPIPGWSFPQPKIEIAREKRPYGSIDVIMYMTSW